jgi:putative ABC transport system permease protein
VFGIALAYLGIGALVSRLPAGPLPGEVEITLNTPVLLFCVTTSVAAALLFGIAPALCTVRGQVADGLRGSSKSVAAGRTRFGEGLIVAEVALSFVLLVSAGLLIRSFLSVIRVDLGFQSERLLAFPVGFPPGRYATPVERDRFFREALDRLAASPAVAAAAATTGVPPFSGGSAANLGLPGLTDAASPVSAQVCTADYFRTVGIDFKRGSGFTNLPLGERPRLVVVNDTLARQHFQGREVIGQQIRLAPVAGPVDPMRHGVFEIAGVVADVRNKGPRDGVEPQVYLPWSAASPMTPLLLVRTTAEPARALADIRSAIAAIDRQIVLIQPRTIAETLESAFYAQPRFSGLVLGLFAAAGTLLVGIGVFSVMAYSVSRRKKEIAVRMALGASAGHVFRTVVGSALGLTLLGAGLGLGVSFATSRMLASQLWNVSGFDALTPALALCGLLVIAGLAAALPARRATLVDPLGALRDE